MSIEFLEANQCAVSVAPSGRALRVGQDDLFALEIAYGSSTNIEIEGTLEELEELSREFAQRVEKMRTGG